MNENIVVVGANSSLAEQLSSMCEKNEDKIYFVKEGNENGWNRASPISARSSILQMKNILGEVHKAFVVYNSSDYMRFNSFDVETISKGFDSMILGFSYFASEISKVFYDQGFGELIFVVLEDEEREKSILENVGLAAFSSLAESFASKKASKQLEISLVRGAEEVFENNMEWLSSYLNNANSKKAASMPKHANKWIKVGSKTPVILPFIK